MIAPFTSPRHIGSPAGHADLLLQAIAA